MAELYSCPTCQTLLRVPPGVETVLCPKCQTVLSIAPSAPASPPPTAAAPPLPFAPKSKTKAKPSQPETKKPKKAVLVDEAADAAEAHEVSEAERKRTMRKEIVELEKKQERQEEKYQELTQECARGQFAIDLIKWGVKCQALAVALEVIVMLVFVVAIVGAVAGSMTGKTNSADLLGNGFRVVLTVVVPLAMVISSLGILSLTTGMGYAMFGPKKARHVAILGMVASILHIAASIVQAIWAIRMFIRKEIYIDATQPLWQQAQPIFDLCGLITDIPLLSEHPARFMWRYNVSWVGIVAGALEFTRLVSVCLLAQIYAEEGKAVEKGHASLKGAYRVFWLMLLAGLFRVLAAYSFDWVRPNDEFMVFVGLVVHGIITFSITMGLAMILYSLSNVLDDIKELVDPIRFASKGPISEY